MGRERLYATISADVSRHNSEDDVIDDALWEEFMERVRSMAQEPKYERIMIDFDG